MKKLEFSKYERVNKQTARKLFNKGFDITIVPCNCFPGNMWGISYTTNCYEYEDTPKTYCKSIFDKLINSFIYYNCNNELGEYPAFYVNTEKTYIQCEFSNGANPVIYRGTPMELLKRIIKIEKLYYIQSTKQHFLKLTEV